MQDSAEKVWSLAQEQLRKILNRDIYSLWFANIRAKGLADGELTLEVADDFWDLWLKENYLSLIQDVLGHVTGERLGVRFVVEKSAGLGPEGAKAVEKEAVGPEAEAAAAVAQGRQACLDPRCTFEGFVVGNSNSFAHAAATAVAKAPGLAYNPLFLYGGVGLGKTHLLQAIGNYVLSQRKSARVAYVSSERFTNEFIDALQGSQLMRFRRKYRHTDVLLIDDVQFLANKERIQEEFFHTFNALHEARKQIVLTCDRPAGEIRNLERRLVSRFEWGLVADLQPPDMETRVAILRKKEQALGVGLSDEIVEFLASRIRANIRRLEGALVRVACYASLTGKTITVEAVEDLLRDLLHEEGRHTVTIEVIQKRVADHFEIRQSDMISKRRPENIAFPRQVAMYLARRLTENSLNAIGEAFGGRDHGTVLHACRQVKDRMEVDAGVRQTVAYLERQLQR